MPGGWPGAAVGQPARVAASRMPQNTVLQIAPGIERREPVHGASAPGRRWRPAAAGPGRRCAAAPSRSRRPARARRSRRPRSPIRPSGSSTMSYQSPPTSSGAAGGLVTGGEAVRAAGPARGWPAAAPGPSPAAGRSGAPGAAPGRGSRTARPAAPVLRGERPGRVRVDPDGQQAQRVLDRDPDRLGSPTVGRDSAAAAAAARTEPPGAIRAGRSSRSPGRSTAPSAGRAPSQATASARRACQSRRSSFSAPWRACGRLVARDSSRPMAARACSRCPAYCSAVMSRRVPTTMRRPVSGSLASLKLAATHSRWPSRWVTGATKLPRLCRHQLAEGLADLTVAPPDRRPAEATRRARPGRAGPPGRSRGCR